jgi:predicted ribosome quality control (RQC) complex YloA/Tae2 family protein
MKTEEIFIPSINENIIVIIGQNAEEKFEIIDKATTNDIWFHVHNYASCHVIIPITKTYNKKQLNKIIIQGAVICKKYSKYNSVINLPIIYTKIKYVEKTEIIGSVFSKNTKIITI